METPRSWRFEEKEARDLVNTAWWEQLNDPVLNELIDIALGKTRTLRLPLYPRPARCRALPHELARMAEIPGARGIFKVKKVPRSFSWFNLERNSV